MNTKWVYANGPQELTQVLQPRSIFIAHEYFGSDMQKRTDYRLPFLDSIISEAYQPLFPDEVPIPGVLLSSIAQHILNAGASIFDIGSCNANVLVELGIAIGLNRPILTVASNAGTALPDALLQLEPLRFANQVQLARSVMSEMTSRLRAYSAATMSPYHCTACGQECEARRSLPPVGDEYVLVGISEDPDDIVCWNIEQTLKNFKLHRLAVTVETSRIVCSWIHTLRQAKIALFQVSEPYNHPENAKTFLQLGLAAGLNVPWAMICVSENRLPSDLEGILHASYNGNQTVFRSTLGGISRGLLLSSRPIPSLSDSALPTDDGVDLDAFNEEEATEDQSMRLVFNEEEATGDQSILPGLIEPVAPGVCFRCRTVNDRRTRFCRYCGYDLSGARAQVDRFLGPNGRPLRCRLTFLNGVLAGRSFTLHQDVTTIGRTTGNDVLILDGTVSRNHARLIFHNGQWSIEDVSSANGTQVNGQKIKRPRVLHSGDQIRIGDEFATFEVVS